LSDLKGANPSVTIPVFSSGAEFSSCFFVAGGAFDKPVVLFLDEFDLLYSKRHQLFKIRCLALFAASGR
jgi:hypothetical protein